MTGITRRGFGAMVVASALDASAAGGEKKTFVLVHGAWHGAWCWRPVEKLLRAKGHEVFALTLTGLAERAHLLTPEVSLSTHVDDVVKLIEVEDLSDVVLVGHSYGGLVISGATKVAGRLKELVYLDAFVPAPGQSGFDLLSPKYVASWKKRANGGPIPPILDAKSMGIADAALAKKVDAKLTPQPLKTFEEGVQFDEAAWKKLAKTYVWCKQYGGFGLTAERARKLGFTVKELESGHDAMLAAPEALAELLDREEMHPRTTPHP